MLDSVRLEAAFQLDLGISLAQLRAVPVQVSPSGEEHLLIAYSSESNIDPYYKNLRLPHDTLKLVMTTLTGQVVWRRDIGPGIIPGIWFFPFVPFDLDGDGVDELWIVNNLSPERPFNALEYVLERLDARTGEITGQWPWPHGNMPAYTCSSHSYRFFIFGGHVNHEPALVTAQGTYGEMHLQGWSAGVTPRWTHDIPLDSPGARGSHMTAIIDLNQDGTDEVLWGERCIELDGGRELFCADKETYRGHSDASQPVYDWDKAAWRGFYTLREKETEVPPRVCFYDCNGDRVWGRLERGHIHHGWVARLKEGNGHVGMAAPNHVQRTGIGRPRAPEEYYFDIATGREYQQPVSLLGSRPVDIDGDGCHEFAGDGKLLRASGAFLGEYAGQVALTCRFLSSPGEHLLTFDESGMVRAYRNVAAHDNDAAKARYAHPAYQKNRKLTGCGYNRHNLGGI